MKVVGRQASAKVEPIYVLRLYVSGATVGSTRAVEQVRRICDEHLSGRYELEVVDVYQQPELALHAQILTVPTLVKSSPAPARRILGDLSDRRHVLRGLDLKAKFDEEKRSKPKRT